jgi:Zn-dependent peptidase ImmA (M78 family)
MAVRRKMIRKIVEELLDEHGIKEPPVDVEKISESYGLSVVRKDVESISGFIIRSDGKAVIGVNSNNAPARQRFTIAHELGHYLIHPPSTDDVHVDSGFEVRFRDELSSQGTDKSEQEANFFAAELLMPQKFLEADLRNAGKIDLVNGEFLVEGFLENLAQRYNVSSQSLLFRLTNLGVLNSRL